MAFAVLLRRTGQFDVAEASTRFPSSAGASLSAQPADLEPFSERATLPKPLPYFRWYPADAESDQFYASLTQEERGVYHTLLNYCWMNDGIPSDLRNLARICRITHVRFKKIWVRVGERFVPSPRDILKFLNARLEKEFQYAQAKSLANQRIGNANAFGKKRDRVLRAYDSVSLTSKNQEEATRNVYPPRKKIDPLITAAADRMYDLHPKKKELAAVPEALSSAVNGSSNISQKLADIESCHKAWCNTPSWKEKDGRFAPQLAIWLIDRGFTKRPASGEVIPEFKPYVRNKPALERIG